MPDGRRSQQAETDSQLRALEARLTERNSAFFGGSAQAAARSLRVRTAGSAPRSRSSRSSPRA